MSAAPKLEISQHSSGWPAVIRLARPHQWIRNALVLAPLVFGQRLFEVTDDVVLAVVAFVAFCALSSAGYVLNDIADRDADRMNPENATVLLPAATSPLRCDQSRPDSRRDRDRAEHRTGPRFPGNRRAVRRASTLLFTLGQAPGDTRHCRGCDRVRAVRIRRRVAINVEVSPWLVFITFVLPMFLVLAR